jgi:arginyl-tRNA synthetase
LQASEGAEVVDLEAYKMPPCLIITGDGTTLYATRDIAAAKWRQEHFKFNQCLYVVGSEQILHFRQVFKVLELMHYPWATNLIHVHYGMYRFKDGKFSTRKGRIVKLTEVIDEARDKVLNIIAEKNPDLAEKEKVAEMIGLGAVVFNDLSTDRVKDVEFDWNTILDFEGDTGPYLQYTHARASSILRQATAKGFHPRLSDSPSAQFLQHEAALDLCKHFGRLSTALEGAIRLHKPSIVANYSLELAKAFNSFYRQIKVLDDKATKEETEAKLFVVKQAKQVMQNSLALLCMGAPEQM